MSSDKFTGRYSGAKEGRLPVLVATIIIHDLPDALISVRSMTLAVEPGCVPDYDGFAKDLQKQLDSVIFGENEVANG